MRSERKKSDREIIKEIEQKRRFGALPGAVVTGRMLSALGEPLMEGGLIHIAGTNGKGSVSAFLSAILQEAGLRVGMFTSPHLVDFRERIRVDGEMIGEADAARLGEWLLGQEFPENPAMFDYCTVMALRYFRERRCDVVVAETGLGGRLDSTNALGTADISVITRIGYDHMEILGNTLEEIAAEKAGIIKRGTRLILASQEEAARRVLLEAAEEKGVPWQEVRPEEIRDCRYRDGEQRFSFRQYEDVRMRLLGVYQYENAAAAILAAEAFLDLRRADGETGGQSADWRDCVSRGIARARWPGRMEILCRDPFVLVDGAHNVSGVRALRKSLEHLFPGETFRFVMGVLADKDYEEMAGVLLPLAEEFLTVTVESSRALDAEALAQSIRKKGVRAQAVGTVSGEIFSAGGGAGRKTVAFGSLYFVGSLIAVSAASARGR